jgi:hypothetical protein
MLSSSYDRFELEQDVIKLYNICEDIDLFLQHHIDGPRPFTEDEVWNVLHGLKCMHELRISRVEEGIKKILELDEYCKDPEKLKRRKGVVL